jgi:hypothetical protein
MMILLSCDSKKVSGSMTSIQKFNGIKTVFINKIILEDENSFALVDTIQFFSGEEAVKAYRDDNNSEIDEATFYMRNLEVENIKYELIDDLKILVKTFDYQKQDIPDKEIQGKLKMFSMLFKNDTEDYYTRLPFKLYFTDGIVSKIEEIYIP